MARPEDLRLDTHRRELAGMRRPRPRSGALVALLADELLISSYLRGCKDSEGEVLELPLDRVDPEPMRQRRTDLERSRGPSRTLLRFRHRAERPHVVEPVGELIRMTRTSAAIATIIFGTSAWLSSCGSEGDPGQLRDAVDEVGDLLAEAALDLGEAQAASSTVSCRSAAQSVSVSSRRPADLRDLDRMADELLAGATALVGVALAGEDERPLDLPLIDRLAVVTSCSPGLRRSGRRGDDARSRSGRG
ncbi:MAG: hypothetical protein R2691_11685 [Solirubrobacterales bacterium]